MGLLSHLGAPVTFTLALVSHDSGDCNAAVSLHVRRERVVNSRGSLGGNRLEDAMDGKTR